MRTLQLARLRAMIGAAFALLGIGIGVQLLLRPDPIRYKLMGLGFAGVLIALGAVRIRGYLLMRKAQP